MRSWIIAAAVLLGGSNACLQDSSGVGSGGAVPGGDSNEESTDGTSGGGGSTAVTEAEAEAEADGTSVPGTESTGGDSADGADTSNDGEASTSGTPGECDDPAPFTIEITVDQAIIEAPMMTATHPTHGTYAYSEVEGQGKASFQFQLPCGGEFSAFAHVYDPGVGTDGLDPSQADSYYVAFDGDDDVQWLYGCQTVGKGLAGWLWLWEPLRATQSFCDWNGFSRTLDAGTHLLHLRNREAGEHQPEGEYIGQVAAVTRVVVTNDPGFSP